MTPWKRAWLYVCRERKRSIRLILLCLVLTVFMQLCSWVQASMAQNAETLRKAIGASFRIEDDADGTLINDNLIAEIEDVGNILRASGENLQLLYSESVLPRPGMLAGGDDEGQFMMSYYSGHYSEMEQHFRTGELELIEGRHITPEDSWSAVISRALAEQNGLSVGDRFEAGYSPETRAEDPSLPEEPFSFTIVGTFDITGQQTQLNQAEPSMLQNAVFIDAAAGHAIDSGDPTHSRYRYGVIFMVDDPRNLEQTVAAAQSNLDMQHFRCVVDDTEYRQSVQPLERMETTMKLLTVVLVGIGTIILALVLLLWIRQRTKEIGIYLSVGLSKRNILLQLLTESVVSSVIGGSIAIPLTFAITAAVRFSGSAAQMLPAPPTVSIIVTWIAVLAVSILATLLAAIRLLQLHPKDILSTL